MFVVEGNFGICMVVGTSMIPERNWNCSLSSEIQPIKKKEIVLLFGMMESAQEWNETFHSL